MRPRSVTGPLILIAIGAFFLINNLQPDLLSLSKIIDYWPFLLIGAGVVGLLEVLFHASRGVINPPPRPLSGIGVFWVIAICFILGVFGRNRDVRIGPFGSSGVNLFGSDYDYDVNATESSRGVARVVLDNLHGNVSIKGQVDVADVRVTGRKTVRAFNQAEADRDNQELQIHMERQGDLLLIRSADVRGRRFTRITSDLDIIVPKGIEVESRGRTGDLTIDDVDGAVAVSSGRGDLRLSHIGRDVKIEASRSGVVRAVDVKGNFDLQGRGSDIQLENIAGVVTISGEYSGTLEFRDLGMPLHFQSLRTELRAEAVPGNITMDLGALKMSNVTGPVHFQTGARDIEASDISEALELNITRGDIEVTETKSPLPRMDIHARNGDIALTLPENGGFEIHGVTSQGDVESAFGSSVQIQTSGHSATITGRNGTGPLLNISTDRGTVSIKKS